MIIIMIIVIIIVVIIIIIIIIIIESSTTPFCPSALPSAAYRISSKLMDLQFKARALKRFRQAMY